MTKERSYIEVKNYIAENNDVYAIGVVSTADVMRNQTFVRSRLVKLIVQITDYLQKHGITKRVAVIPEENMHFYSTFFSASGFDTYLMTRFFSNDNFTEYKFVSADENKDMDIYNKCSLVIILCEPEDDRVQDIEEELETDNVVIIEVANLPKQEEIDKIDNPNQLLNAMYRMNIKRKKGNPYDFMPQYEGTMYTREPLTWFEQMIEEIPQREENDRFVSTSNVAGDNIPPDNVRKIAQEGLDLRDKYNRGGTDVGIARARDLSNGENVSDETIQRMHSFFSRHEKNRVPPSKEKKKDGGPTNGWIAWQLWGGDAGKTWAEKRWKQIQEAEK